MAWLGDIGHVTKTRREVGGVSCRSFEWTVPQFLSLDGNSGDYYSSPIFSAYHCCWNLWIHPHGIKPYSSSDSVTVTLRRRELYGEARTLDVTLGVRGLEGEEASMEFLKYEWERISNNSFQRSRLETTDLVLVVDMKMHVTMGVERLVHDFCKLLASSDHSDVTVRVGGAEFRAHRLVLSARCPAFSAMFAHPTAERESGEVRIGDCEPEVFGAFLRYIYTGCPRPLRASDAPGLYRLADMYLAPDLKSHCLRLIRDTLCKETFCEAASLALRHGERGLYLLAVQFAKRNGQAILGSAEWERFRGERPSEAREVLAKCFIRPSASSVPVRSETVRDNHRSETSQIDDDHGCESGRNFVFARILTNLSHP